jgi:hypothetical protein
MKLFYLLLSLVYYTACGGAQSASTNERSSKVLAAEIKKQLKISQDYYNKVDFTESFKTNTQLIESTLKVAAPGYISKKYRGLAYNFLVLNDTLLGRQYFEKQKAIPSVKIVI